MRLIGRVLAIAMLGIIGFASVAGCVPANAPERAGFPGPFPSVMPGEGDHDVACPGGWECGP